MIFAIAVIFMLKFINNSFCIYDLICLLRALVLDISSYISYNKATKDYPDELFETYLTL